VWLDNQDSGGGNSSQGKTNPFVFVQNSFISLIRSR